MQSASKAGHQEFSASVRRASENCIGDVSAFALVRELLDNHTEYGGGAPRPVLEPEPARADKLTADAWLTRLAGLFDAEQVPVLHGRHVLVGLALLEPRLARRLRVGAFLHTVVEEVQPEVESLLSQDGAQLYKRLEGKPESVPLLSDRPAEVDQLNRKAFAEAIADRIQRVRSEHSEAGAFLVHIYGPWGIGKTSLLQFIGDALCKPRRPPWAPATEAPPKPWVVVDFNAWEHQRIAPPWWWLMTAVYRGALRELRDTHRWRPWLKLHWADLWWRFRDGWSAYVLFPIAIAGLWAIWRYGILGKQDKDLATAAKDIATLLGAVITVWGLVHAVSRWLLLGSPRGAVTVLQRTRDPMGIVRRRFAFLIKKIDAPVAIFIDDLDRCRSDYVVELLEGIQTLFVTSHVTYVVAADRGWLCESYAKTYEDFASRIDEPGRPLGYHFLEKTFQLSVAMPRMSSAQRRAYLDRLLGLADRDGGESPEAAREAAEQLFANVSSEQEVRLRLEKFTGRFEHGEQALREAAVSRLAAPDVQERTEHMLKAFADLLEANPRAMKRLLNAYGVGSALQVLQADEIGGDSVRMEQLVLWTILGLRWPLLAEYLGDRPGAVESIANGTAPENVPKELAPLFDDDDVRAVVRGDAEEIEASLDEEAIRAYAGLAEAESKALRQQALSAPPTLES